MTLIIVILTQITIWLLFGVTARRISKLEKLRKEQERIIHSRLRSLDNDIVHLANTMGDRVRVTEFRLLLQHLGIEIIREPEKVIIRKNTPDMPLGSGDEKQ